MEKLATKNDIVRLARKYNKSHHYKAAKQMAPHHFKENMKIVAGKARAEMEAHRRHRKEMANKGEDKNV